MNAKGKFWIKAGIAFGFVFALMFMLPAAFAADAQLNRTSAIIGNVKVENESIYTPYPAEPGEYVDLWIRVRQANYLPSVGSEDVICTLYPNFPFTLEAGEVAQKNIGKLNVGQMVVLKYRLRVDRNAYEGANELSFSCSVKGYDSSNATFRIYVQTHDAIISVSDFNSKPEAFLPGENGSALIVIKNLADSPLKDISVSLDFGSDNAIPFAPFSDSTQKNVKQIESAREERIEFGIMASPSASVGIYKIPATITYSDILGKNYTKKVSVSLLVAAKPQLFLSLESTDIVKAPSKGRVTVLAANNGLSAIKFLSIKMAQGSGYRILSSKEQYLGNIEPDETTSADFEVYVEKGRNEAVMPIEAVYTDEFGAEHAERRNIVVQMFGDEEALELGLVEKQEGNPIVTLIIAGVAIFILWKGWGMASKMLGGKNK